MWLNKQEGFFPTHVLGINFIPGQPSAEEYSTDCQINSNTGWSHFPDDLFNVSLHGLDSLPKKSLKNGLWFMDPISRWCVLITEYHQPQNLQSTNVSFHLLLQQTYILYRYSNEQLLTLLLHCELLHHSHRYNSYCCQIFIMF